MESEEKNVILMIADISGYTRFMVSNTQTLQHSQIIITELIQAIIKQIELPLEIAKLEGDAVFLYLIKSENEAELERIRRTIGLKLITFFQSFSEKIVALSGTRTCECNACLNIEKLKLKIIVHCGKALLYRIGRFNELAGVDVITVHRLLKNSVTSPEYILMTEAAYREMIFPHTVSVVEGNETYDEIGTVKTFLYEPSHFLADDARLKPLPAFSQLEKTFAKFKMISRLLTMSVAREKKFNNLPLVDRVNS
jgi:class 3 adenylate cyclase